MNDFEGRELATYYSFMYHHPDWDSHPEEWIDEMEEVYEYRWTSKHKKPQQETHLYAKETPIDSHSIETFEDDGGAIGVNKEAS